jgi:hypothetical protein
MMNGAWKPAPRPAQIRIQTGTGGGAQSVTSCLTNPIFSPTRNAAQSCKPIHGSNNLRTESRNVLSYLIKPLTDSVSRTFRE